MTRFFYQSPDGRSGIVTAASIRSARCKVWNRLIQGLPFLSFAPDEIQLEERGPA